MSVIMVASVQATITVMCIILFILLLCKLMLHISSKCSICEMVGDIPFWFIWSAGLMDF